jgi:hypothetical protein
VTLTAGDSGEDVVLVLPGRAPVKAGARIVAAGEIAEAENTGAITLRARFFDAAGDPADPAVVDMDSGASGRLAGFAGNAELDAGAIPAGAASVQIEFAAQSAAAGPARFAIAEPLGAYAGLADTTAPDFTDPRDEQTVRQLDYIRVEHDNAFAVTGLAHEAEADYETVKTIIQVSSGFASRLDIVEAAIDSISLDTFVTVSAFDLLEARVTETEDGVEANAVNLSAAEVKIGEITAGGYLLASAAYTPGAGFTARVGMVARVGPSGTAQTAGLFFDVSASASRAVLAAGQVVVMNAAGAVSAVFDGTNSRFNNSLITNLTASNIQVGSLTADLLVTNSIDASVYMLNGSVVTGKLAGNAVSSGSGSRDTSTRGVFGGVANAQTVHSEVVDTTGAYLVLILGKLDGIRTDGSGQTPFSVEIRRGGSALPFGLATVWLNSGGLSTGQTHMIVPDFSPASGSQTYSFWGYPGADSDVLLTEMTVLVFKR